MFAIMLKEKQFGFEMDTLADTVALQFKKVVPAAYVNQVYYYYYYHYYYYYFHPTYRHYSWVAAVD